jgi:hypothetical protein
MKKLLIEEAEQTCPDMIKGQFWISARSKYWFNCDKHGKYRQEYNAHFRGQRCRICFNERTTQRQFNSVEQVYRDCPDMLEGQTWKGVHAKYKFWCSVHAIVYERDYNTHRAGRSTCPECRKDKAKQQFGLTIAEAERRFPDMVKGQIWVNAYTQYKFYCEKHNKVYLQVYTTHADKRRRTATTGCEECWKNKIVQEKRMPVKQAYKRFPDMVEKQEWKGTKVSYWFTCLKHGNYKQSYSSHSRSACPKCYSSKGELAVRLALKKFKLIHLFEEQKRFSDLRNKHTLPFDFCSISKKIAIEYHGEQHYHPVTFFGGDNAEKVFKERKRLDSIKERWAEEHGYRFIAIPYTVKNIEGYLQKLLAA